MSAGGRPVLRWVAEFGVIVVGVLVALFMESAWERLQEQELAAQYRERLAEELAANQEVLALDRAFTAENCRASQAAFDGLTEAQREVVGLSRIAGLSSIEIAERTGREPGAVRVLLQHHKDIV